MNKVARKQKTKESENKETMTQRSKAKEKGSETVSQAKMSLDGLRPGSALTPPRERLNGWLLVISHIGWRLARNDEGRGLTVCWCASDSQPRPSAHRPSDQITRLSNMCGAGTLDRPTDRPTTSHGLTREFKNDPLCWKQVDVCRHQCQ